MVAVVVVGSTAVAYASFANTAVGGPMTVTTATLTAPTGLSASNPCSSATTISSSLSWTASTAPATSGYSILRSTSSGGTFSTVGSVGGINTATYIDTVGHSAVADSIYVAVKSANGMDVASMSSNTVTAHSGGGNLKSPTNIAVSPDGTKAYVSNSGASTVTPIALSSNTAGTPITLGSKPPQGIAFTPDGTTAWVADGGDKGLWPITVSTDTAGTRVGLTYGVNTIAITSNDAYAWFAGAGGNIQSMNLSTHALGTAVVASGGNMQAIAITPDGTKAYVADASGNKAVWPVILSGGSATLGSALGLGFTPQAIAITPDGTTAWVAGGTSIAPINLSTGTVGTAVTVSGAAFQGIAVSPNGCYVYAADSSGNNQIVVVDAVTQAETATISVGTDLAEDVAVAYPPVTYYYEVQGTRNAWTSPVSGQASLSFGQPNQSS